MKRVFVAVLSVALWVPGIALGDVITQWNFNSAVPDNDTSTGTTNPSVGAGVATLLGTTGGFASGTSNGGSSDPALTDNSGWQTTTYAAQGTEDSGRGVQFNVSTLGYTGISIGYDLRHSNTSSRFERLEYTLDGSTWNSASVFDGNAGDTWFNGRSFDFSGIGGSANNPNFGIRVVATFASGTSAYAPSNSTSTYATTGTWRFDMVTVSGIAIVPEPGSATFLGLIGLVGLVRTTISRLVNAMDVHLV